MRTKTELIFDMDGTLVDSSELLANTINYVRKKIGLAPMNEEKILAALNDTSINPAEFYYGAEKFEPIHETYFQEYYLSRHHIESRLYDGMEPLLRKLSETRTLHVATNAYDVSALPLLEALGIASLFHSVICANQVPAPKPHPAMLETIIDARKRPKTAFVMIGDGKRDAEAAHNAGIDALLVEWGFSSHGAGAIDRIETLAEVLGV